MPKNERTVRAEHNARMEYIRRQEDAYLARLRSEVPSPDEMDAALERIKKAESIAFELDITGWRTVYLTEPIPLPNQVRKELTIIFFKPVLAIPTPFLPELRGWVALTLESFITGRGTLMLGDNPDPLAFLQQGRNNQVVGFRPCNDESRDWLRLCFARAMGMKFREHSLLDSSKIIYTATP